MIFRSIENHFDLIAINLSNNIYSILSTCVCMDRIINLLSFDR